MNGFFCRRGLFDNLFADVVNEICGSELYFTCDRECRRIQLEDEQKIRHDPLKVSVCHLAIIEPSRISELSDEFRREGRSKIFRLENI